MQLVFGKENPFPGNLMETMENGYMHYQLADPLPVEDSFRRALDIRRAAEEAFRWIRASDALRRAATSSDKQGKIAEVGDTCWGEHGDVLGTSSESPRLVKAPAGRCQLGWSRHCGGD